jgi:PIN domain nuclease of toxin-antitoxin system
MAKQLTEEELRRQAVQALSERLGPVDALRFLSLISREPFDYQQWRKEYFSKYTVDELLQEVQHQHDGKSS